MRDERDCPLNSRGVLARDSGLRDQDLNPVFGVKSEIGRARSYSGNSPHQRPKECFTVKGLPLWNGSNLDLNLSESIKGQSNSHKI